MHLPPRTSIFFRQWDASSSWGWLGDYATMPSHRNYVVCTNNSGVSVSRFDGAEILGAGSSLGKPAENCAESRALLIKTLLAYYQSLPYSSAA